MRILLVEDDALLGDGLRAALMLDGYVVDWASDGEEARLAWLNEDYGACVLDLGLPRRDGLSVLKEIRNQGRRTPVLILSARDTVQDKVGGLDAGADDYLLKPFELDELRARLRAMLRRAAGEAAAVLSYANITLDPVARRVMQDQKNVVLSAKEYALLLDLFSHKGHIRSKHQLESSLYAWGEEVESNAVEVYIHHLRKKLGADSIRTVRGLGYLVGDAI